MKKLSALLNGSLFLILTLLGTAAMADDDVAALVVDNGDPVSVPEPGMLPLLLVGGLAVAVIAYRNRNK